MRQSVTILSTVAPEVRRGAKEQLKSTYEQLLVENDPALKNDAGKDLIRAIFGKDAIADDSIR